MTLQLITCTTKTAKITSTGNIVTGSFARYKFVTYLLTYF